MLRIAKQDYLREPLNPFDLRARLKADLTEFYGRIATIRHAGLGDLWEMARDLVVSLDQWGNTTLQIPGSERMEIALDVAWWFVEGRGGAAAIRERLAEWLPLPAFIERRLLAFFLTDGRAKAVIRFVLELAVREIRKFRD